MSDRSYLDLGEAIQAFIKKYNLRQGIDLHRLKAEWSELMGEAIAKQTEEIWITEDILHIRISSPAWRNELQMARIQIREKINQRLGRTLIREVKIH